MTEIELQNAFKFCNRELLDDLLCRVIILVGIKKPAIEENGIRYLLGLIVPGGNPLQVAQAAHFLGVVGEKRAVESLKAYLGTKYEEGDGLKCICAAALCRLGETGPLLWEYMLVMALRRADELASERRFG